MNSTTPALAAASLALVALVACRSSSEEAHLQLESGGAPAHAPEPEPSSIAEPLVLGGTAYEAALLEALPEPEPEEGPGLYNVFELSDSIISGSEPAGREALELLAERGVRTLLSVDGKAPDAEMAAELGMRYVHIPIQYSGIEEEELLAIAKVFRELEGPFYVHCFHGRHRGPAAAAVGRLVLDGAGRERALAEMRQWCATSGDYEGLYQVIASGELPDADASAAFDYDFPTRRRFEGLRGAMVPLVRHWDEIKAARRRGWTLDEEHPDVVPAQEALQMAELYVLMQELDDARHADADFADSLTSGRAAAETLYGELERPQGERDLELLETAYEQLGESCKTCHRGHRNRR